MEVIDGLTIGYNAWNIIQEVTNKELKIDIHSVNSNSFYARVYPDDLLLVSDKVYGALPFGISVDLQQQGSFEDLELERGLSIKIKRAYLSIPQVDYYIDLHKARVWYPKDKDYYKKYSAIPSSNLDYMISHSKHRIAPGHFPNLFFLHEDILLGQDCRTGNLDNLNQISFDLLTNLVRSIRTKDYLLMKKTLSNSIGLGPGLTPYMDDVVIGIVSTLHVFKYSFPSLYDIVTFLSHEIYELRNRTTSVSRLYLTSVANGDVLEIIDDLIFAVLFSAKNEIKTRVNTLLAVGSTSGTAILLGLVLGFNLIADLNI